MALVCPRDLNDTSALAFVARLPRFVTAPNARIDFSVLRFARPYATLLLAEALRDFVEERRSWGLDTRVEERGIFRGERQSAISYLGHVGFFEYVGVSYGNLPGAARGGPTYLPITIIRRGDLRPPAPGKVLQDAIVTRTRHLAEMVFDDECQQDMLGYCLREIVRNVFEHAEVDSCALMAQKYAQDDVEIAIADRGIGVLSSMRRSYALTSATEALRLAIQPGVSGIAEAQQGGVWDNTGFGLYVASQLGREHGSFAITSSGASLAIGAHGESLAIASTPGTLIKLQVSVSEAEYFPNRLQQIVDRGEREIVGASGRRKSASMQTRSSRGIF